MTLSKYVTAQIKAPIGTDITYYYDNTSQRVIYQPTGHAAQNFPAPTRKEWAPLSVRFTQTGDLLVTNLVGDKHEVVIFPAASLKSPLDKFSPQVRKFGTLGKDNGQLSYPNSVVTDSKGNYYVSDGNNARISAWDTNLKYRTFFGFGSAESALNLPRGMWMDAKDHLLVVDAVGAVVRVYDTSKEEPVFLYSFGLLGTSDGQFNYPNDICLDANGNVYVADRENNRITIWSY
jgi:sugar lactone lactonase YvrE